MIQNARSPTARMAARVDRAVGMLTTASAWLVLPVSLLLFLQWPLRDIAQVYSREANDLAQILFALYVSLAVTEATRRRAHLATDAVARNYPPAWRTRLERAAALCVLVPWSVYVLTVAWFAVAQSVRQLERFPETYNPGYFAIKLALALLLVLVAVQALLDAVRPARPPT